MVLKAVKECLPALQAYLKRHNGLPEEARDVLHDAVLVMYNRIRRGGLQFTGEPGAFLLGICKNEWKHRLREKNRPFEVTNELPGEYASDDRVESEWQLVARQRLYLEKLDKIGDPCRKLLESEFQGKPLKEVAKLLGYTYNYVRQKKRDCIMLLTRLIKQDPRYRDLI